LIFQLRKKNRFSGEQLGLPEDFCVPLSAAVVELVKILFSLFFVVEELKLIHKNLKIKDTFVCRKILAQTRIDIKLVLLKLNIQISVNEIFLKDSLFYK
jgi:hypothetical protein